MQTFLIGQSRHLILYPFRDRIFQCILEGGQAGRPVPVADDYEDGLTVAAHCFAIYYAYISQSSQIRISCLFGKEEYRLSDPEGRMICHPKLLSFRENLIVFYVVGNGIYEICGTGIGKEWTVTFPQTFDRIPVYECHVQGDRILLQIISERDCIWMWSQEKGWERLTPEGGDTAQKERWQEIEQKLEEKEGQIRERDEKMEEKEEEIRQRDEKMKRIEKEILEKDEKIEQKKQEIRQQDKKLQEKDAIIESIKKQYEELMDVATQYRSEAARWRDQFIRK